MGLLDGMAWEREHGAPDRPIVAEQQGGVHSDIIGRYDAMLAAFTHQIECRPEPGTEPCHLRWMLRQIGTFSDAGKAGRWLGFIQGLMIERGLTTVQVERDFTRPYFTSPTAAP